MQRNFASNLALCATLSQALASRLLMQQAMDGLTGNIVTSDGTTIQIDIEENGWQNDDDVTPISFAQTTQQNVIEHGCTFVMDRHKISNADDFYSIVNNQSQYFTDNEFPTNDAHYFFDGGNNETGSNMVGHSSKDSWHRINEGSLFKDSYTLFGNQGIRPQDIRQGEIGNCWFLSSITALAEYPGRIESTFLNKELSEAGVYGVQMYALGVPITIMVDDQLPLYSKSGTRTRYSKIGTDGALWGPIMEKAFAKFHGNYARIVAGDPVQGVSTMNGSPYMRMWTANETADTIWETLLMYDHDLQRGLMQAGTHSGGGRGTYGLVKNHAYVIIGVDESNGTRRVLMRNPWGTEGYNGQYADGVKDGDFYMTLPEFLTDVQYIGINLNTENWFHDYYLVLNDDGSNASPGKWNFCGSQCVRYEVQVTNEHDQPQTMHVSGNTWRSRSYPATDKCQTATYDVERAHSIYLEDDNRVYTFWNDSRWVRPLEFAAGETKNFLIELDLYREGMSRDWSVAAWGELGPVKVTVESKGPETDKFPYVKEDNSKLPENEGKEDNGGGDSDGGNDNEAAEAGAKKCEDAEKEAKDLVQQQEWAMQTVDMKTNEVIEHAMNTSSHLLTAQLQMERAKKAYEDAIICCGLTFVENGDDGQETTLEQLAGYIKIAKEAAAAAEEALKKAREEHKEAQEEKKLLEDAIQDIKDKADKVEELMKTAGEELENIKKLQTTPEQQQALARAQEAYDDLVAHKQAADEHMMTTEDFLEQANEMLQQADENENAAVKHVQDSAKFVDDIQALIDERVAGDDDAAECADGVEDFIVDIGSIAEKIEMRETDLDKAAAEINDHEKAAAQAEKDAMEERKMADMELDEVDKTNLEDLQAALDRVKDHQSATGIAHDNAKYALESAKFSIEHKVNTIMENIKSFTSKQLNIKEEAKQKLEECENWQDTVSQKEDLTRATEAYENIVKLFDLGAEIEMNAIEVVELLDESVFTMKQHQVSADQQSQAIDKVIAELKVLIKAAGGDDDDDDGDCDNAGKYSEMAEQHLTESTETLQKAQQLHQDIAAHVESAKEHYMTVMSIKSKGEATVEAANADKADMAKLEAHKEEALMHLDDAMSALNEAKTAKAAAHHVHDLKLVPLMDGLNDLGKATAEQRTAVTNLMEALEMAKATFNEADGVQNMAVAEGKEAGKTAEEAAVHVDMAQECHDQIKAFVQEIEQLIEDFVEVDPNDQVAEQAAEECENAEKEAKQAMTDAKDKATVIDNKKVAIDGQGEDAVNSVEMALNNQEEAMYALEEAVDADLDGLYQVKEDVNDLEEQAANHLNTAQGAYSQAMNLKGEMNESMVNLPMYAQLAEAAKLKAEAAYNIAKEHMDTPAQKEAEEKARIAYQAAQEHCTKAKKYLSDSEEMASKADEVIQGAMVALEAAQAVNFDPIQEEIDDLIEEAENNVDDKSALENWLDTLQPGNFNGRPCNSRSTFVRTSNDLGDGVTGIGAVHTCEDKNMTVQIKGKRGVKRFSDKIKEIIGWDGEPPVCTERSINRSSGWQRCTWTIKPEQGKRFGITFDGIDANKFSIYARLQSKGFW